MTHEEAIPIIQGGITMRKKTRRFIGALLAMVLAFSSVGEALPAFAADELILSDEIGEDILLADTDSPEDVIADESGEDDTGLVDDADTYFNADSAPDASADNYADIAADMDADTAAAGDTQNTQDGKEPNPIKDYYDINGIRYYNVDSDNIDSDKLFYEDLINTPSEYLDGYSLAELWEMTAIGIIPNEAFRFNNLVGYDAKKDAIQSILYNINIGARSKGKYNKETKKLEQRFLTSKVAININYSNFKLSPLLPDASVSNNYVSTSSGERNKAGAKAEEFKNESTKDYTASISESEGGSVSLSSTVNHSSSYSFEEGFEVGAEFDFICAKVSEKVSFKATQAVQNGWSKTNTNTQTYNNSRSVSVTVPAHSVVLLRNYTTDASVITRYNCPVALTYDVEIHWDADEPTKSGDVSFLTNARTNLKHRAFEEGKKDGYDDQGIIWSTTLAVDEIDRAVELITTHVPMSGTGAAFSENLKAEGFKIEGAMPLYPLEKIKLMKPNYSFVENNSVDYNNLQYYTANMKVGDFIAPDSLELNGFDRDGVPYCKFSKAYGSWNIVDENGLELDEENNSPVISRKIQGQERFIAVRPGTCYAVYKIDEEKAKYNSYEQQDIYVKNEDLKSTAALKLVVGITDYFEITGSYNGKVGAGADSIAGDNKLSVKLRDFTGKEIDSDYTYEWEALDKSGIILTEDGKVTFTKPGTYKVRVFKEYMGGQKLYSDPVEITATEAGSDPDSPYRFKIEGSYKGQTGTEAESIEGDGKLLVEVLDSSDNEVSYKWKSVELEKKGIKLEDDGMVSFTKAGTFHVRVYVESDGETYYSAPVEITVTDPPAVTEPKALELTYDGTEKELVIAGAIEGEGNRMVYALGDKEDEGPSDNRYDYKIPKAGKVAEYYVWYKCVDKDGKDITGAKCLKVTISKAEYGRQTELNIYHNINEAAEERTIDLGTFLPEDKTGLTYGNLETEGLNYSVVPSINKYSNQLKYTLEDSNTGGKGSITIPVSLDNYKDYNIIINITQAALFVKEPVSSVALNYKSYNIGKGESITLTATVLPMTADQKLKWTADNDNVTVITSPDSLMAYVTGKNAGNVKVTAMTTDGSKKKAVCSFKVGNPVGDFTILGKKGATDLAIGKKLAMTVDWGTSKPQNTGIYWQVDNDFIAAISDKGVLTGRNEGRVKVYAVSKANNGIIKTTDITVYDPVKKAGLSATKGVVSRSENAKGFTLSAYATGVLPNMSKNSATGVKPGERPIITFSADERYLKLTQVDGDPASVVITAAKGAGNVKNIPVEAKISAYKYNKTLTCKVSIVDSNPLKEVKLNKKKLSVDEGNSDDTLSVSFNPVNPDGIDSVTWESSDSSIARVDEKGCVTGVKTGTAVITAKAGDKLKASCNVTVTPRITKITFTNKDTLSGNGLAKGKTFKLKVAKELSGSGKSSSTLDWWSSDPSVASVDKNGVVKALKPGSVMIFAMASENASDKRYQPSDYVEFKVYTPVKKLKIDKNKLMLGTEKSNCYGKITVVEVLPDDVEDLNIKWTVKPSIVQLAAISEHDGPTDEAFKNAGASVTTGDGQVLAVKGLYKGKATITGVAQDGSNKKVTCTVIVK